MDSSSGTTVTVGSVHELANILANMPPEQLQNVQLDPILYNALFQTIDTNTQQVIDNNDQGGVNNDQGVQPLPFNVQPRPFSQVKVNDTNVQQCDPLHMLEQHSDPLHMLEQHSDPLQILESAHQITENALSQQVNAMSQQVNHVVSTYSSSSKLKITKPLSANQLQTLQPQSLAIQKSPQLSLAATQKSSQLPSGNSNLITCNAMTSHQKQVNYQDTLFSAALSGALPGIAIGQPSTVVTTTIMSQVISTPAVQTPKPALNMAPSRYPQVVTLPSNAPLPANAISTAKVNGSVVKVTERSSSSSLPRVSREKVVDTRVSRTVNSLTPDRKFLVNSSVITTDDIPTQILSAGVNPTQILGTTQILGAGVNPPNILQNNTINSLYSSVPLTSSHEVISEPPKGIVTASQEAIVLPHDILGHASLQLGDNVSIENAAIVLTNEQLAELMSGKSVEEVLQATQNTAPHTLPEPVYMNSIEMLAGIPANTEEPLANNVDPEIPPLREIQMIQNREIQVVQSREIQVVQNREIQVIQKEPTSTEFLQSNTVLKPKAFYSKPASVRKQPINKDNLPVNKNSLLVNKPTAVPINKNTLPVNNTTLPVNKNTLLVSKETFDYNKSPGLKQASDVVSLTPVNSNVSRTLTSLASTHKETKSAFSPYNKSSIPHPNVDVQRTYSGTKLVQPQEINQHVRQVNMSGTVHHHNIVPHNNKSVQEMQGAVKNVWPVNKGKNIYKTKNVSMSDRERLAQYQHNSNALINQANLISPANVVKSGAPNHAVNSSGNKINIHQDLKTIGENHLKNSGGKQDGDKKVKYPLVTEREKSAEAAGGRATFNRSFKKQTHGSSESKKRIKKTLKEMEKTYPKEVSEILHIREAIKSSHVGDGENAMRKLAKLEIENQLKRFSQKVNMGRNAEFYSKERKLDIRRRKNIDPAKTNLDKSNRCTKTEVLNETDVNKNETRDDETKDQGRKRERPKKFDDFVLGSKPKKDKKAKVRKFFFPEDRGFDKHAEKNENENENEVPSAEDQLSVLEKDRNEVNENKTTDSAAKKNDTIAVTGTSEISKDVDFIIEKDKLHNKEIKDKEMLSTMFHMKTITPEIKIERLSLEKTDNEAATPKIKSRVLEERSFLDAISGDITPTIETRTSAPTADAKEEEDKENEKEDEEDEDEGDSDHCTAKDVEEVLQSLDVSENDTTTAQQQQQPKTKTKTKKKRKKKKSTVQFEPEVLPEHLKRKTKPIKVEETVIDLSKVQMKSAYTESSYDLSDSVELETSQLLRRKDWSCTLCGKPGNIGTLDVLFGPYKVNISDYADSSNNTFSVWMHRDCAIWTSTIYLNNQKLCGLGEALTSAAKMTCHLCSKVGATLECAFRQCRDNYHFVCAKQRGCTFKMENFTITCPKHR